MRIIGAGFGRTGTDSMRHALNMLGLGPTHHMFEVIDSPVQKERWRAVANGAAPDWPLLFEGFNAAIDWPSSYYWRELMEVYPDALILLTHRSADSWWASFEGTILKAIETTDDPDALNRRIIAEGVFGGRPGDRDHAIATYNAHVSEVLATVPADRLHVHQIGEGWERLCARLGLLVPEVPFPSGNATGEFKIIANET